MTHSSERFPTSAPIILPIPDAVNRPLWSVMIPVYNCSAYLIDALKSVLAQDLGKELMQIQVVDDASTDTDVEQLVARLGAGRVEYFRQEENVGSLRNFETCVNRSYGHLIHLLHGDDQVEMGYYEKMAHLLQEYPQAGAAFCRYASINDEGKRTGLAQVLAVKEGPLQNWLQRIAQSQSVQYASIAVRRSVYEKIGSFYGTTYGEDWEMWVRIARYYSVAYTPEVLAEYRTRAHSITWQKTRSNNLVPDLIEVIQRIQYHLPDKDRAQIAKLSRKNWAHSILYNAYTVYKETKDTRWARIQIKQSLHLSNHLSVYFDILKFYIKVITRV